MCQIIDQRISKKTSSSIFSKLRYSSSTVNFKKLECTQILAKDLFCMFFMGFEMYGHNFVRLATLPRRWYVSSGWLFWSAEVHFDFLNKEGF
jgi:hypothetical protein